MNEFWKHEVKPFLFNCGEVGWIMVVWVKVEQKKKVDLVDSRLGSDGWW